ncbi:Uncharacterised protein [Canicola haemoglobinophilus]|uniref:Lipoprotein n=1 Tax=Canicola haemoglobinophilus TaxID=733 RepID=A0AB38HAR6_9PAST|nr:hypothetical protein [Canicola haemoglobinophilus]STO55032.1 Uncharacterised protein [Canicola haemoglobinophilus]STO69397.1 Uncharacterised protein [Canicola haemoglobinophilus]
MRILLFGFLIYLSGCSSLPWPHVAKDDGIWVHYKTKERPSVALARFCSNQADLKVLGRYETFEYDPEASSKRVDLYKEEGKCLFENGFVFKVKFFSPYCNQLSDVCEGYKEYLRYSLEVSELYTK